MLPIHKWAPQYIHLLLSLTALLDCSCSSVCLWAFRPGSCKSVCSLFALPGSFNKFWTFAHSSGYLLVHSVYPPACFDHFLSLDFISVNSCLVSAFQYISLNLFRSVDLKPPCYYTCLRLGPLYAWCFITQFVTDFSILNSSQFISNNSVCLVLGLVLGKSIQALGHIYPETEKIQKASQTFKSHSKYTPL